MRKLQLVQCKYATYLPSHAKFEVFTAVTIMIVFCFGVMWTGRCANVSEKAVSRLNLHFSKTLASTEQSERLQTLKNITALICLLRYNIVPLRVQSCIKLFT